MRLIDDIAKNAKLSVTQFAAVCEIIKKTDAVEVIRCKDCKHWSDGVSGCTDYVKCCKIGFYMVGANGYCVYGERKTEDES